MKTLLTSMTDEDDDSILTSALDNAALIVLNKLYPFGYEDDINVPTRYQGIQVRLAAYFLNKRGADGELQHNENNVYRYYGSADVPKDMLNEITPYGSVIG